MKPSGRNLKSLSILVEETARNSRDRARLASEQRLVGKAAAQEASLLRHIDSAGRFALLLGFVDFPGSHGALDPVVRFGDVRLARFVVATFDVRFTAHIEVQVLHCVVVIGVDVNGTVEILKGAVEQSRILLRKLLADLQGNFGIAFEIVGDLVCFQQIGGILICFLEIDDADRVVSFSVFGIELDDLQFIISRLVELHDVPVNRSELAPIIRVVWIRLNGLIEAVDRLLCHCQILRRVVVRLDLVAVGRCKISLGIRVGWIESDGLLEVINRRFVVASLELLNTFDELVAGLELGTAGCAREDQQERGAPGNFCAMCACFHQKTFLYHDGIEQPVAASPFDYNPTGQLAA